MTLIATSSFRDAGGGKEPLRRRRLTEPQVNYGDRGGGRNKLEAAGCVATGNHHRRSNGDCMRHHAGHSSLGHLGQIVAGVEQQHAAAGGRIDWPGGKRKVAVRHTTRAAKYSAGVTPEQASGAEKQGRLSGSD